MSDDKVTPYVKFPLKPVRVMPTSGQQVRSTFTFIKVLCLDRVCLLSNTLQGVMGKPESFSTLGKTPKIVDALLNCIPTV